MTAHLRLRSAWRAASMAIALLPVAAPAQPRIESQRGEQLYELKCGACHGEQIHWRAGKLATDWDSLLFEVKRWRQTTALDWSEDDVLAVTHYLNTKFYMFAAPLRSRYRGDAREPFTPPAPAAARGGAAIAVRR